MANANTPFGFRPINENAPTNKWATYSIATGYATALYLGDPVQASGTADTVGRPGIILGTTGTTVRGVFAGVRYVDSNGKTVFSPNWVASTAGTDIEAAVYDDPEQRFVLQYNGALAAVDISNVGGFVYAAGSAIQGSGVQGNTSSIGSGLDFYILELQHSADNALGTNAKAVVKFARHELGSSSLAVGTPPTGK